MPPILPAAFSQLGWSAGMPAILPAAFILLGWSAGMPAILPAACSQSGWSAGKDGQQACPSQLHHVNIQQQLLFPFSTYPLPPATHNTTPHQHRHHYTPTVLYSPVSTYTTITHFRIILFEKIQIHVEMLENERCELILTNVCPHLYANIRP